MKQEQKQRKRSPLGAISGFLACCMAVLVLSSCQNVKQDLVGVWQTELYSSVETIEFTEDGYFLYDNAGTQARNRYRLDGKKLCVYVEDVPDSEVVLPFTVTDTTLTIGEVTYQRVLNQPTEQAVNP